MLFSHSFLFSWDIQLVCYLSSAAPKVYPAVYNIYFQIRILSNESGGGGGNLPVFVGASWQGWEGQGVFCPARTYSYLWVFTMPHADYWQLHLTIQRLVWICIIELLFCLLCLGGTHFADVAFHKDLTDLQQNHTYFSHTG